MTDRPLYGLVLAGGRSRRMGTDKALLEKDGASQLSRAVSMLDSVASRVFVSARKDQADEPERARFSLVIDRYDDMGPVAGILSAMEEYPDVDWLVVACDLPNLSVETLEFLSANRSRQHPMTAFRSNYDGLPEPLCAIYAEGSRDVVAGFADDGVLCPRKMMILSEAFLLDQPDPDSLDNINTPDDLARSTLQARA